jgi:hypothetical protein
MSFALVLAASPETFDVLSLNLFDPVRCSKSSRRTAALLRQSVHAIYRTIVWPQHADAEDLDPGLRVDDYGRDWTFSNHSAPNGVLSGLRGGRCGKAKSPVSA